MRNFVYPFLSLAFVFSFACSKKNVKTAQPAQQQESVQKVEDVSAMEGQIGQEADIRAPEFSSSEGINTIFFEFDKYEISPDMAKILSENAKILKEKKWTVLVEGHCDNRGTIEYNLALGQKRANVVKDYYMKLGVPETSIGTISYGEESPLCKEDNDACWAKNRRAETKVSK